MLERRVRRRADLARLVPRPRHLKVRADYFFSVDHAVLSRSRSVSVRF